MAKRLLVRAVGIFPSLRKGGESIKWAYRPEKRANDEQNLRVLAPLIKSKGRHDEIVVLSLPGAFWFWERYLAQRFPDRQFVFVGIERDRNLNKLGAANAKRFSCRSDSNFRMVMLPPNITWCRALRMRQRMTDCLGEDEQFDIIYADYMGGVSVRKYHELELLCKSNLLAPRGVLMVTFSLTRGAVLPRRMAFKYADLNSPYYPDIHVYDDHEYKRADNPRYSKNPVRLMQGVAKMICEFGTNNSCYLEAHPGHIYYSPHRNGVTPTFPEGSLCLTRTQ